MDIVKQFLSGRGSELVSMLTQQLGFAPDQAQRFVPAAAQRVLDLVKGGGLDVGKLLSGDAQAVVEQVDTSALATEAGVDEARASQGLAAVVPALSDTLKEKAGGAAGVLALLGGGDAAGGLGKLAGSFLKR